MRIFVGIPAYDRRITCETARALLNEQSAAALLGIELMVSFAPGSSLVTTARDNIVRDFLASDFERLMFIDSDVSWEVGSLIKLAHHTEDFVGGAYRLKQDIEAYPVTWLDREMLIADPVTGLLEVSSLPGGFLSVSRTVFERLPKRPYSHQGQAFNAYFRCPYGGGEDGAFCDDWRSLGGKVWLDPELTLSHTDGVRNFTGNIGKWLKGR